MIISESKNLIFVHVQKPEDLPNWQLLSTANAQ